MNRKRCYLNYKDEYIILKADYDEDFIIELKYSISWTFRKWDPNKKVWLIHISCLKELLEILKKYYSIIVNIENSYFKSLLDNIIDISKYRSNNDPYSDLFLLPNAPIELVKSARRVLMKLYHPDVGGNEEIAKRINMAYNKIINNRGDYY